MWVTILMITEGPFLLNCYLPFGKVLTTFAGYLQLFVQVAMTLSPTENIFPGCLALQKKKEDKNSFTGGTETGL